MGQEPKKWKFAVISAFWHFYDPLRTVLVLALKPRQYRDLSSLARVFRDAGHLFQKNKKTPRTGALWIGSNCIRKAAAQVRRGQFYWYSPMFRRAKHRDWTSQGVRDGQS